MSRRRWEVGFLLVSAGIAGLTVVSVPFGQLGPWSAGVLGPLVVVGALTCVLSWPPHFGDDDAEGDESVPRAPWRPVYLTPLAVTAVTAPALVTARPAGLAPVAAVGLFVLVAYTALLLGVVVFLVVLLPLGQLSGWWRTRVEGRRTSAYVPLGALLVLSLVGAASCSAVAFDGLPTGGLGVAFALLGLLGVRPGSITVAHPGWLLAARVAAATLALVVAGLVWAGRQPADADDARPR